MALSDFVRIDLAFLPTLLHELSHISKLYNGPIIMIKRDDQTGLAFGGNKTRKLEYLFADALQHNANAIITAGALQSNHCRQAAAAAAKLGLHCELLLNSKKPDFIQGNVLLDELCGALIHWQQEKNAPGSLQELAAKVEQQGYKPYIIPYGGSNRFGVLGYVHALLEIMEQQKKISQKITHIVFASCSGATHVGLVLGARLTGFKGEIIGISVDYDHSKKAQYQKDHVDLANSTAGMIGLDANFTTDDFNINYEYAKEYGVLTKLEQQAIELMASKEGILLDPVYTGRAFGGLLDMIQKGILNSDDVVLFIHTGGTPSLFAYADQLSKL